MSGRVRYSSDFKDNAVNLVLRDGVSVKDVSDELGVTQKTIYDWLKRVNERTTTSKSSELLEEIEALKAELEKVKAEREVLRQAAILMARSD